ncbi:MAG: phosphoribosylglycinamide formyltransferase [Pseudohongiella sp.]|nr:phosphoribosylglycinamide formyltransferase [Pseudohongiella sp.]MDP2127858.1 phosphoribosylglycinamide formyltransferase [Pseudohongiella sp.]
MTSGSTTKSACRVVVLISGNGSNLQALIDYPARNYDICCVISNRPEAFGLERATKAGIKAAVLDHKNFESRESFDQTLMQLIDSHQPDLIVLAGFMRILSSGFVQHYTGRLLNIHPSLLPLYKGTNTHQRVLDAGDKEHGVSVHFVTEELDGGPVILQAVVPVIAGDTKDSLAARVAIQEHRIYPEAVTWFAQGRLDIAANGVCLDGKLLPAHGIQINQI